MLRSIAVSSSRLARHAANRTHSTLAQGARTARTTSHLHAASANARRTLLAPLTIRRALATITNTTSIRGGASGNHVEALAHEDKKKDIVEFQTNPVLNWKEFPDFATIRPDHVVPAVTALVQYVEKEFTERSKHFSPTWEGTMGLSKIYCFSNHPRFSGGVLLHLREPTAKHQISMII